MKKRKMGLKSPRIEGSVVGARGADKELRA
jgi:hypothetical protein